jgi:hypothetical protein
MLGALAFSHLLMLVALTLLDYHYLSMVCMHNDSEHNGTRHNYTEHNDTQYNHTQYHDIQLNNEEIRHSAQ